MVVGVNTRELSFNAYKYNTAERCNFVRTYVVTRGAVPRNQAKQWKRNHQLANSGTFIVCMIIEGERERKILKF